MNTNKKFLNMEIELMKSIAPLFTQALYKVMVLKKHCCLLAFVCISMCAHAQQVELLRIERMDSNPIFSKEFRFLAVFSEPVQNAYQDFYYRDIETQRYKLYSTAPAFTATIKSLPQTSNALFDSKWVITVVYESAYPTADIYIKMNNHNEVFASDGAQLTAGFSQQSETYQYDRTNTITVTTTSDTEDWGDGKVTLREAIILAHNGGTSDSGDTVDSSQPVKIDLTSVYGTITLSSRLPAIDKDISISGDLPTDVTIDGNNRHRIFFVRKGTLDLKNLILQNGRAKGGNGACMVPGGGGGGMGGAIFINKNCEAICENIQFLKILLWADMPVLQVY
jgi:hypothetical protein